MGVYYNFFLPVVEQAAFKKEFSFYLFVITVITLSEWSQRKEKEAERKRKEMEEEKEEMKRNIKLIAAPLERVLDKSSLFKKTRIKKKNEKNIK